jgi:threonine synthase
VDWHDLADAENHLAVAHAMLVPFFEGDPLAPDLMDICREAFSFPTPLVDVGRHTSVLELFHGPTSAFKDYGARFLASCLSRLNEGQQHPLTILVATSGDTGGAVASAFDGKPNVQVIILYPEGRVSQRQAHQLCCWSDNIRTFSVDGDFDACQAMVKAAFKDEQFQSLRLSSANSINIGRLLPQMTYYGWAAIEHQRRHGLPLRIIVPTGNVGNVMAALWAREMGLPIESVVIATNRNRTIPDYLHSGQWAPEETIPTLANAMDVSRPSNWERLIHRFGDYDTICEQISATSVDDTQITEAIQRGLTDYNEVWCPHTACGVIAREQLSPQERWTIAATAHPAKFETVVEPLIGRPVTLPASLAALLQRPTTKEHLPRPSLELLRDVLFA